MKRVGSIAVTALLLMSCLMGCTPSAPPGKTRGPHKLSVVTTLFPGYDFARAVAGEYANVTLLIPPGTDIHSFDPSPGDILAIGQADVFIYNGGPSEAWVEALADTENAVRIRLMEHVQTVEEESKEGMQEEEEEEHGAVDEHIWTSPQNAMLLVQAVAEGLCEADAAHAQTYRTNAQDYIRQLEALDAELAAIVREGRRNRIVVADRFPFRYLVDAYGLDYRAAFAGCSVETDCSAATLAYLIDMVRSEGFPYVYYVERSNQRIANAVREQTGAGTLLLHSCQTVTKPEFDAGETYLSLMWQNAENLRKGLGADGHT